MIEPKVKKIDGVWHLHGKNLNILSHNKSAIQVFLTSVKKGIFCGFQESWEFKILDTNDEDPDSGEKVTSFSYHQKILDN